MKKQKLILSLFPIILISNLFSRVNKIFAMELVQTKYGMQPLYGIPPSPDVWAKYGPMPAIDNNPIIIKVLLYIVVPVIVLTLMILGTIKLIRLKSKNRKNTPNVK